jgi:very-short-patch-repair endonuclease
MSHNPRHRIHPTIRQRARELRRKQTPAEQRLWQRLRASQLAGHKFRRQHPIGRFIVDFYCAAARLVVEVDGDIHARDDQAAYDAARTEWLEDAGCHVLRVTNHDVRHRLDAVLEQILRVCDELAEST